MTTSEQRVEADTVEAGARVRWDAFARRFPRGPAMLVLVVLVLLLNGITLHKVSNVSAIDERYWIDHLVRASNFEVVQSGDRLTQEAVREVCERGADFIQKFPTTCPSGRLDPEKYGFWKGVNIAGHSPFYFFVTAPIARVLRATPIDLPPDDSLVTWARLLGSAWLLLGWYLVLRVGDLLCLNRRWLVAALLLLSATPALLHASTTVNPDQTAVPAGAAVLLAALAWERRGRGMWVFALTVLVAAALDPTNSVAVVAVLVFLGFRAILGAVGRGDDTTRPWIDYVKVALVAVLAAALANRGWNWIESHYFNDPLPPGLDLSQNPIATAYDLGGGGISFWQLFGGSTIFSIFPPFADIALPRLRDTPAYLTVARLTEMLAIGAMVAVVLRDRFSERAATLGFALVAALLATPTLLVLYNYWVGGTFDQPVARYGLSALPVLAIVLVASMRTKLARVIGGVVGAALFVSAIAVVLT